jgi:hypothetical protein
MPWRAETDPSEETWAETLFRSDDDSRLVWLRAAAGVQATWLVEELGPGEGGATRVGDEQPIPVSDVLALVPEHAHEVQRMSRQAIERYEAEGDGGGLALAEELADAVRELEREDVPATSDGTHTKRGEDVVPPPGYPQA